MGTAKGKKTAKKSAARKGTAETAVSLIPQPNGRGALLSGGVPGNRGGTGRPPNVIRDGFRQSLPEEVRRIEEHVRQIEAHIKALEPLREKEDKEEARITTKIHDLERLIRARSQLADFLARYGLGTTITETDTAGDDVTVRVVRQARRAIG